ncbi:MAG: Do family serine endopeptidase [Gemmatimonadales bacterium]
MSSRARNWLKFGGLVGLTFALGLLFSGLLDLPRASAAQQGAELQVQPTASRVVEQVTAPTLPAAAAPLADLSDAFAAVAGAVKPSVVFIEAEREVSRRRLPPGFEQFFGPRREREPGTVQSGGSGFVVSRDGYILTNHHVVEEARRVIVHLEDRREYPARVIGSDPNTDVAVLKVDADNLVPAALGNSDDARVGEWVLAIGNPLGNQLQFTVTSGIVSAKGRGRLALPGFSERSIQDFIQTDAAINPGNSGGPLVNVRGEVIGVNSAIASETGFNMGYGFAIPINLARSVMDQLIATGRVERAALGVTIDEAGPNDAAYVGLDRIRGVVVQNFSDDSPAEKAGLQRGDVIIAVNGKRVDYVAQLQTEIGFRKPGDVVRIDVARKGGERATVNVKLTRLIAPEPEPRELAAAEGEVPDEGFSFESLGISVVPLSSANEAQQVGLPGSTRGLLVVDVERDGPAAQNLVPAEEGGRVDVIVRVEGKPVATEAELRNALRQAAGSGGIVSLDVVSPSGADAPIRRIERVRLRP